MKRLQGQLERTEQSVDIMIVNEFWYCLQTQEMSYLWVNSCWIMGTGMKKNNRRIRNILWSSKNKIQSHTNSHTHTFTHTHTHARARATAELKKDQYHRFNINFNIQKNSTAQNQVLNTWKIQNDQALKWKAENWQNHSHQCLPKHLWSQFHKSSDHNSDMASPLSQNACLHK